MDISSPVKKSMAERIGHALLYEGIAIVICSPVIARVMHKPLSDTGALGVMMSLSALTWNIILNILFDFAQCRFGFKRNMRMRAAHAILFEGGLVFLLVPLAAWWLSISLWQALVLDFVLLLFFLPYTFIYNLTYDIVRALIVVRRNKTRARQF